MNKKKVLIIDDEIFIIDLIKDILSMEDIDCISAENFESGIELFSKEGCDLVLADKNIENSSFESFMEEFRSISKNIPVVLMTGERGIEDEELEKTGINEVIYKPFKMDSFLIAIKGLLEIK
jgi:DNA-binding NtrC family response regulator